MGHAPGGLKIGPRDCSLLRAILHAVLVRPKDLLVLLEEPRSEPSRNTCYNRLKRLRTHGYIEEEEVRLFGRSTVYRLTSRGAQELLDVREMWAQHFDEVRSLYPATHWFALTQIRIILWRAKLLGSWMSRVDLRYLRQLESTAFSADYDAVVTLRTAAGEIRIGLLVEHRLRSAAEYAAISRQIEQEQQLHWVLCLVADNLASRWLQHQLPPSEKYVLVATTDGFVHQLLQTSVYLGGTRRSGVLNTLLLEESKPGFFSSVDGLPEP